MGTKPVAHDVAEQWAMDYMAIKGRDEFIQKYGLEVPVGSTVMAAMLRKYAQQQNDRLQLIARQLGACDVCWTVSWAPCDPGDQDAVQDPHNPTLFIACQMCSAERWAHKRKELMDRSLDLLEKVSEWLYHTAAQSLKVKVDNFLTTCGRRVKLI